ncbi:hypothetical protein COF68_31790 [Bacillus toyonensis]|uniref:hypothetical protein n=1 Tax=Bacillus toyonensis TaxID=155322 RepID=UPI000BF7B04E|nr:hypothetical protein [Bacillus toyonensis]PGE88399.1 hypothetical protein COM75_22840 [Bacillus toyonensis]PHE57040.1 hypothetical protein COF68_31790 [Bacillus toyonensis]
MFKKVIPALTAVTLSVGVLLPTSSAFADSKENTAVTTVPSNNVVINPVQFTNGPVINTEDEVEAAGKFGWAVKAALHTIKASIKGGDWILGLIEEKMGSASIKYLRNNVTKVNKGLDKAISKIDEGTNYVQANVRDIIFESLRSAGVPNGTAMDLAENIAATISFIAL